MICVEDRVYKFFHPGKSDEMLPAGFSHYPALHSSQPHVLLQGFSLAHFSLLLLNLPLHKRGIIWWNVWITCKWGCTYAGLIYVMNGRSCCKSVLCTAGALAAQSLCVEPFPAQDQRLLWLGADPKWSHMSEVWVGCWFHNCAAALCLVPSPPSSSRLFARHGQVLFPKPYDSSLFKSGMGLWRKAWCMAVLPGAPCVAETPVMPFPQWRIKC